MNSGTGKGVAEVRNRSLRSKATRQAAKMVVIAATLLAVATLPHPKETEIKSTSHTPADAPSTLQTASA